MVRAIILSAAGVSIGIILILVGSIVPDAYWPLLSLIPGLLMIGPILVCSPGSMGEPNGAMALTGIFLQSSLITSCLAIPLVQAHVGAIEGVGTALSIVGQVLIFASYFGYQAFGGDDF